MKYFRPLFLVSLLSTLIFSFEAFAKTPSSLHDLHTKDFEGKSVDLATYKGQVVLIVNTASKCGFTPQLGSLQKLQEKFGAKGFQVLAFPSNDFKQDAGTAQDSAAFAEKNYQTHFKMMDKVSVTGDKIDPVFKFLTTSYPTFPESVLWNFEKFLVNKEGKVIARYRSMTDPMDGKVVAEIEKALGQK